MGKKQSIRSAVIGGLVGALVVMTLPAIGAVLNQSVGDPLSLGNVNRIDDRTDLKGAAKGANLQIKNTGNSRALSAKADKIPILAKATSGPVAISAKASRNAIKIKVDDGQAPIKVNPGAGTATNLSADQVDGKHAAELIRVYGEQLGCTFLSCPGDGDFDGFQSADYTLFIGDGPTAPTSGFFHIMATVNLSDDCSDPGTGFVLARLTFDPDGTEGDPKIVISDEDYEVEFEDGCGAGGDETHTLTLVDVVAVPAGSHSVALEMRTGAAEVFVQAANITTIFSPFGSAGAEPIFLFPIFPDESVGTLTTGDEPGSISGG